MFSFQPAFSEPGSNDGLVDCGPSRDSRGRLISEVKFREEEAQRERAERVRHVEVTLAGKGEKATDMKYELFYRSKMAFS